MHDGPATPADTAPVTPDGPGATVDSASATTDGRRAAADAADATTGVPGRRRLTAEVWIVLGLSLGQSGVYALLRLWERLTREVPLAQQSTTLNPQQSPRPWLDLTYQLVGIGFALVPVALALFLLSGSGRSAVRTIGLDAARPGRDLAVGVGLAAAVGIPGLGLYLATRALGLTVQINPSGLEPHWWAVPVLVVSALQNALLEEVVAVGYLLERLRTLRWGVPAMIVASALLRGSYHLYQGPGMAAGNVVMGVLFAWWYLRTRRVMPLVVAHTLLDVGSFVGFAVLPDPWLEWLGVV